MSYYRICHFCGAALDPGEICEDCQDTKRERTESEQRENKEKAVPVLEHRDGRVEWDLTGPISTSTLSKN